MESDAVKLVVVKSYHRRNWAPFEDVPDIVTFFKNPFLNACSPNCQSEGGGREKKSLYKNLSTQTC